MAAVGPRWLEDVPGHVRLMIEEFSKVHRTALDSSAALVADVAYGEHERQKLDIYSPRSGGQNRPAVLFVHGGAFVDGHRNRTPQIYSNVSRYFARHGIVGVNVGYRLAPEAVYPKAQHASSLGIDPRRVFLMGHSAGGAHVASYAYDSRLHGPDGPGLAGLIIISGRVRADNLPENPNARKVEAYYGTDASTYDDRSPVSHVTAGSVPTFVAWGEYENALIDVYCAELTYRLGWAKRQTPPIVWLKGHNHTSMIAHIDTAEDVLGNAMQSFIDNPG